MELKQDKEHFEKELKLVLSLPHYEVLSEVLAPPFKTIKQYNLFFDSSEQSLSERKLALRLRKEGDNYLLTLKGPVVREGDWDKRLEVEESISEAIFLKIKDCPQFIEELECGPINYLKEELDVSWEKQVWRIFICFENLRKVYRMKGIDDLIELDQTHFQDGSIFYEMEMESTSKNMEEQSRERLFSFLKELGIPWNKSSKSKLERALEKSTL